MQKEKGILNLQINLADHLTIPETYRRSGKEKSTEEIFMQSMLPPVVHSKNIENEYELVIDIKYGGMDCGAKNPQIFIPLTLVTSLHNHDAYV